MTFKLSDNRIKITIEGRIIDILTEPEKDLLSGIPTVSNGSVFRTSMTQNTPILVDKMEVEKIAGYQCSDCGHILNSDYNLEMHKGIVHAQRRIT